MTPISAHRFTVPPTTMFDDLKTRFDRSMKALQRFLDRPISVKKGSLLLGVPAKQQRAERRAAVRQVERRMQHDLFTLMKQHPESRKLMRHLGLLERTLRREGYEAVEALPKRVIEQALSQLERLVWDWTPTGLAELRSRLAVIVKTRAADAGRPAAADSVYLPIHGRPAADVTEVDHETYEEMERSWTGRLPLDDAKIQAAEARGAR